MEICVVSFFKGTRGIERLEYICTTLLLLSAVVWIISDAPLLNLLISLLAHCICKSVFPKFIDYCYLYFAIKIDCQLRWHVQEE